MQDACTSGSATSVDLGDLPFDMPKLRRRLRQVQSGAGVTQTSESSCISQASSSQSVRNDKLRMGKRRIYIGHGAVSLFLSYRYYHPNSYILINFGFALEQVLRLVYCLRSAY